MNNGYLTEELEAALEALESDESDESDEFDELAERSRRRRRSSRPRTAPGTGLVPPKPSAGFVTEARLEAALARVGTQIKTNSDAIAGVNSRLTTISTDISSQSTKLRREADERKKEIGGLKNNVQLTTLLPLLIKPASKNVTADVAGTELKQNDKILVDKGDSLTTLLPLLLMGGMGTSSDGSTGGGGFNDPTTMLLVVLAASGGLGGGNK